jgi:hypothetical protein
MSTLLWTIAQKLEIIETLIFISIARIVLYLVDCCVTQYLQMTSFSSYSCILEEETGNSWLIDVIVTAAHVYLLCIAVNIAIRTTHSYVIFNCDQQIWKCSLRNR